MIHDSTLVNAISPPLAIQSSLHIFSFPQRFILLIFALLPLAVA
jgi:hypothetical protein